ncbi:uracil/xanthine transporter [Rummeliibacillus stabekisii]|uniref:uracil/xanthine transporter n=1 Tax=Rummeliibacillus stabekisii TaxID=241244 RepID=UPI00116AA31D|nr:uracil/xanthine transporter [Rummeliibacillus stabekisii]MBB5170286.1 xanthine/uracil permease [Rummeliibacillus stabekisii]GEL04546.1 purine permease YbbY [Rummeliibacillus stabekisii]
MEQNKKKEMKKEFSGLKEPSQWIAGIEWFFFIFANIVIIPLTVGKAFKLGQDSIITTLQLSFLVTGAACLLQAFIGHKRAILEGQSGLWWGMILSIVSMATAQGTSLGELGGSLTVGILISAVLNIVIGLFGWGPAISKLFKPGVMAVFMLLFGIQLIQIFLKGMLGIPMGNAPDDAKIKLSVAVLTLVIAAIMIFINVKAPVKYSKYSLLGGIVVGWIAYALIFGPEHSVKTDASFKFQLFNLGKPAWNIGIIAMAVITGLMNLANTFGALKGTENLYDEETSKKQYKRSLTISGVFSGLSGLFGLVPYAPFVSSIGFLEQSGIVKRLPFVIGSVLFFMMGLIPPAAHFFSNIPLSIGSMVLFVAYLQLLNSSMDFFKKIELNKQNVYRSAIPLFLAVVIMIMPDSYFSSLPKVVQPIVGNGLLMGILIALILENTVKWNRIKPPSKN